MMIRSESDLREAKARLADLRNQAARIREELRERGLAKDAIDIAATPQETLADDVSWEVRLYERLKSGQIDAIPHYAPEERGKALICLRIVKGWTQRQLAESLGVSEAVVSRDERSDYRRLVEVKLNALGVDPKPAPAPAAAAAGVPAQAASAVQVRSRAPWTRVTGTRGSRPILASNWFPARK